MAEFVKIIYGDSPITARAKNSNKVAIIGRATTFSGVIDNLNTASVLIDGTYPGILATDPLYIAINDFLGAAANSADVLAYAVPTSASVEYNVEFVGPKNGVNLTFTAPYSPLSGMVAGSFEMYTIVSGEAIGEVSGWQEISSGYTQTEVGGIWNGAIVIDATGLTVSGAAYGEHSGLFLESSADKIRADLILDPMSIAFKELMKNQYVFQYFAFAYDPSLEPEEKYTGARCYSNESWLKDVYYGAAMAQAFNSSQKRCGFIFSLPETARMKETIASGFATGTAYDTEANQWNELKLIVGTNEHVIPALAYQLADANAIDPALDLMAGRMRNSPRLGLTYQQGTIAQTDFPDNSEVFAADEAHINIFGEVKGLTNPCWIGEYTFGAGNKSDVNYMQCINLLANEIETNLYNLLATRNLYFDIKGMQRIRSAIIAAENKMVALGYIDGPGTVTIPIEDLVKKESSLSSGDLLTLAAARTSKQVGNITVTFVWNGNIRSITVSALTNA